MSLPPLSAFISYAKADQAKAQEIADALEARGFRCWIAPRDVRPGRAYGDEIIRGIEGARALILVLSSASNDSPFVSREIERAVSKRKPIFTIRVEDVVPSPALELFVSSTQWIDAYSGRLGPHADRLAGFLAEDEGRASSSQAASPLAQGKSREGSPARRSPLMLAGGAAALLALIGALVFLLLPGSKESDLNAPASAAIEEGFFGPDTRRELDSFDGDEKARLLADYAYVGVLADQTGPLCNATLVGRNLILTSGYCFPHGETQGLVFEIGGRDGKMLPSALTGLVMGPAIRGANAKTSIAVATLERPLGDSVGWVKKIGGDPGIGDKLDIVAIDLRRSAAARSGVMVSGASTRDPNCAVIGRQAGTDTFAHRCISPIGSGGAPIFDAATGTLVGIVGETDTQNGIALAYRANGAPALIEQAGGGTPQPDVLSGTWTGSARQTGGGGEDQTYTVVMRLAGEESSIDYPSLGCGGSLTALSLDQDRAQFKEHITYGNCVDGGTIDVERQGDKLAWKWSGIGDLVVTADLETAAP
ncbi:MAG TPA: toll/interleukin-1 receptor domain-containing protein [Methyloceanibacter sp.]|nr:toll/interleukin-1 receptor domain-containing protein [Methyloceanibacter sp.]